MRKNFILQRLLNLGYNLPVLICGAAFVVSNVTLIQNPELWILGILLLLWIAAEKRASLSFIKERTTAATLAVSLAGALHSGMVFYRFMRLSSKFGALAAMIGIPVKPLVAVLGVGAGAASGFFLLFLSGYLRDKIRVPDHRPPAMAIGNGKKGLRDALVCLAAAVIFITICSKSSPLYPFNEWVDVHCFFTIGKSMLSGLLPYRDLYEQKGPLLYFLFALASLVSYKTFFGVYLMEVAAAWAFLLVCRKILVLYLPSASYVWVFVIGALVYSAESFCQGGSTEELCLPLLAYCLYCGLKTLRTGKPVSGWEGFWIGVTSACVLWIKYTMLGLYIGWFLAFCIIWIREKRAGEIFRVAGIIALGVVTVSIPVLVFFWTQGALADLLTVYFYNNMFLYGEGSGGIVGVMVNLSVGNHLFGSNNPLGRVLLFTGLLGLANAGNRRELLLMACASAGCFFFTFFGGAYFDYYPMVLSVFAPMGIAAVMNLVGDWFHRVLPKQGGVMTAAALAASVLFCWLMCPNTYLMRMDRQEMPQVKFAEIIAQKENATLLNYGFLDGGFYTVTGIVPNCRFFCRLNIPLEEMYREQERYLEEALVDFVVSGKDSIPGGNYSLVAKAGIHHPDRDEVFYLHQRNEKVD